MQNKELIDQCEQKARQWLAPAFDEATRKAVQNMLDSDNKDTLIESFYKDLEFGTGGLRGISVYMCHAGVLHPLTHHLALGPCV